MKLLVSLLCGALMALASPAWADVSREDAAAVAQRVSGGGRVLSVDSTQAGGRPAWRVKVVTAKGEVRMVLVDAATGKAM
jgi:uncharacterized membrane protein YkoI